MKVLQLTINGISCAACISTIENSLNKTNGISNVAINLLLKTAKINYEPSLISSQEIINQINRLGYDAVLETLEKDNSKPSKVKLIIAIILSTPLLLAMITMAFNIHYLAFLHNF